MTQSDNQGPPSVSCSVGKGPARRRGSRAPLQPARNAAPSSSKEMRASGPTRTLPRSKGGAHAGACWRPTQWLRPSQSPARGRLQLAGPVPPRACPRLARESPSASSTSSRQLRGQARLRRGWESVRSVESLPLYQPCISCYLADQDTLFLLPVMRLWKSAGFCCFMTFSFHQPNVACKIFPNTHNCVQNFAQDFFFWAYSLT